MDDNGMPVAFTYLARTAEEIEGHLSDDKLEKASLVYLIISQPVKENVPPFVLAIFGTNNKFTAQNVLDRWEFIKKELSR